MSPTLWFRSLSPAVVSLALAAALAGPTRAADDFVVGMSAAFTGSSRGLGIELYRGSKAWFDEINAKGGVHGHKIVLKAYDDGYNPTPAIENTVKLIEQDHAFVLFDYVGTPTVTRVLPLLKRYESDKVFLFCPFTGAEPMRQAPYDQFVFNLRASYKDETAGLVNHFVDIGRKKIAIFYQIDAYGRSGWEGVRAALADRKPSLSIAAEATYRRGAAFTDSMKPQVDILRAADPDAVICVGAYAACAAFIRDARDADWDVPIANVSFVGSESLLALLKQAGDASAKDYTKDLINSQVVPSPYRLELEGVQLYRDVMDRRHPDPPEQADKDYKPLPYSFVSLEGFLNARLLTEVLDRLAYNPPLPVLGARLAGLLSSPRDQGPFLAASALISATADNPQRDRIVEQTEAIKDFDLGIGALASFGVDNHKHQAMDHVYFTVATDGKFMRLPDETWKEKWGR